MHTTYLGEAYTNLSDIIKLTNALLQLP